jgi:hypothetical protein
MFSIQFDPTLLSYGFIIYTLVLCIGVYILVNLYRKVKIYENWSLGIREQIEKLQRDVKEIDVREIFKSDDDVGFIYGDISDIIKNIDHGVNPEKTK